MLKNLKNLSLGLVLGLSAIAISPMAQAETIEIQGANGITLTGNLELADGQTVKDGMVLLTHGTLGHGKMEIIVNLQTVLLERGISSLAPTLGLGVSNRTGMYDCAVPHTHKHSDAMDEIGLWLGWLKDQGSVDVVLTGHSRGGNQTAWYAAREANPRVSKVILIAPSTWSADGTAKGFKKNHKLDLSDAMKMAKALVSQGKGDDMLKGMGVLYCPGADVTANSFISYYEVDDRMHTPVLMPMINKPVLVIAGTDDNVVKGLIDATQPLADAGKVTLSVIDGAGHFFRDLYAEDVVDAMEEFMQ